MRGVGIVLDSRVDSFDRPAEQKVSLALGDVSKLHQSRAVKLLVGAVDFPVCSLDRKERFVPGAGACVKRSAHVIKKAVNPVLLVVGEDIKMNEIILTNAHTLVGCFRGRKFSSTGLKKWVNDTWLDIIPFCLKVYVLLQGWIAFKFHEVVDLDLILSSS